MKRMNERNILVGHLITFANKYEETKRNVEIGNLSYSYDSPCLVTYCPTYKKYLVQDGNHRAIQKAIKGSKRIACIINEHQPRYYPDREMKTIKGKNTYELQ